MISLIKVFTICIISGASAASPDCKQTCPVEVVDSVTFGGFKVKSAVWPLKGSGVLLKQHCSITLVTQTAQQGKSDYIQILRKVVTSITNFGQ